MSMAAPIAFQNVTKDKVLNMKAFLIATLILISSTSLAKDEPVINGKPIICNREAYNCPSYKGKYQSKRLRTCKDVKTVFNYCEGDPHGLDRDSDGIPCEEKC